MSGKPVTIPSGTPVMNGKPLEKASLPTRRAFSERMLEYGAIDSEFAVFDADIGYSTYACLFGDKYPERYFNVGIAELNMVAAAAGMAADGRTVVVSSYGVFLTMRALEVVRSFVCYPRLNVKILSSHGGLTAAIDGTTHQATEDIGIMTMLPNMTVLCPSDSVSAGKLFDVSMQTPGPVFTRLMRDPLFELYSADEEFPLGGSKLLRSGGDVTIATYGDIVFQALEAAETLSGMGIEADVLDLYSLKPLDAAALLKSASRTGALLVVENHQRRNGLGYEAAHLCMTERKEGAEVPAFAGLGLDDTFGESGDYPSIIHKYGISAARIVEGVNRLLSRII
jgi:transketolase